MSVGSELIFSILGKYLNPKFIMLFMVRDPHNETVKRNKLTPKKSTQDLPVKNLQTNFFSSISSSVSKTIR
jgi:hypothetical protein